MAALPPHTACDVHAVMEIIFVLFSATTLSLTHVVSFMCAGGFACLGVSNA